MKSMMYSHQNIPSTMGAYIIIDMYVTLLKLRII